MISVCRPKSNTGSVVKPQTTSFGLLLRDLEPLLTPDTFNTLVVDLPAFSSQKGCDATVTVTTILTSEPDNLLPEDLFTIPSYWSISLSGTGLTQNPAGSSLRDP